MEYYTYAFLREDGTPYYIGKGKGKRIFNRHRRINPPREESRIIFLKKGLSNEEACKHEIYMISVLGRKDIGTGILRNGTDGGEGTPGRRLSAETKKLLSEQKKGRVFTEEHKAKLSTAAKKKVFTPEHRRRMLEGLANYDQSAEKNPNYGKKWYNNGKNNLMAYECPPGYKKGRLRWY